MTRRLAALLFLATLAALLPACANTGEKSSDNEDPTVSKIPWNRPESWEGAGPLGGMMQPQGR